MQSSTNSALATTVEERQPLLFELSEKIQQDYLYVFTAALVVGPFVLLRTYGACAATSTPRGSGHALRAQWPNLAEQRLVRGIIDVTPRR